MGVSKVGGIFVHKKGEGRFGEKTTKDIREYAMKEALPRDKEAQAQELAEAIASAAGDEILQVARALVAPA